MQIVELEALLTILEGFQNNVTYFTNTCYVRDIGPVVQERALAYYRSRKLLYITELL